jgi:hypothetical protein
VISIIISACLISNPGVCRDHQVPLAADVDAKRCLFEAQPHLPRWAAKNPKWEIRSWRCAASDFQEM